MRLVAGLACLTIVAGASGAAGAQNATTIKPLPAPPRAWVVDGRIGEWTRLTPTLSTTDFRELRDRSTPASGTFGVTVWIALDSAGLWVAARVTDDSVSLPRAGRDLLASDHPEVWLSFAPPVLPALGYGHQFGFFEEGTREFCLDGDAAPSDSTRAKCDSWLREQRQNRSRLVRTFTRQYAPASDGTVRELYTTMVEREMRSPQKGEIFSAPECCRGARSAMRRTNAGYDVELYLPSSEFPLAAASPVTGIRMAVDFVDADKGLRRQDAIWSTSAGRKYAERDAFAVVVQDRPLRFESDPALLRHAFQTARERHARDDSLARASDDSARERSEARGGAYAVIYRPGIPVRLVAAAANVWHGYQYLPSAPSPSLVPLGVSVPKPVARCAAAAMYVAASGVDDGGRETVEAIGTRSGKVVSREPLGADEVVNVVSRSPCVHAILITTGTRSSLGSGQGGAEPRVDIHVVSLDSAGNVRSLLRDSADTWNQEYKIAGDTSTHYTSLYVAAVPPRADGAFGFSWDEEGGDNKVPPRLYKWDSSTRRYVQVSGITAPP